MNHGPPSVSLLEAKQIAVRSEASRTLKQITGIDYGFVSREGRCPCGVDAEVAGMARQRSRHCQANASLCAAPFEHGRLLVCSDPPQSKVFEFDADAKDPAKPRWQVQMSMQPWACAGLPDGRRLVASYGGRKVVEFGPENDASKPLWNWNASGWADGVQRSRTATHWSPAPMPNWSPNSIRKGRSSRSGPSPGVQVDVQRLDSGNTLVTLQNGRKVIEIDNDGNIKWSTKIALMNPFRAQRLENGNTLIAVLSGGKVVEVNAAGDREEWSVSGLMNPYHARRLSNGNTLVADQNGIYEYEPAEKKVVWKLQLPHVSRISRF